MRKLFLGGLTLIAAGAVAVGSRVNAQHTGHHHLPSGYAEFAARPIKALSNDQIADLRAGHGMGLSLPANSTATPDPSTYWNWPTRLASVPRSAKRPST